MSALVKFITIWLLVFVVSLTGHTIRHIDHNYRNLPGNQNTEIYEMLPSPVPFATDDSWQYSLDYDESDEQSIYSSYEQSSDEQSSDESDEQSSNEQSIYSSNEPPTTPRFVKTESVPEGQPSRS